MFPPGVSAFCDAEFKFPFGKIAFRTEWRQLVLTADNASVYERDLILNIESGVVVRETVRHNGKAPKGAGPGGYRIDALTTFGGRKARTQK